MAIVLEPLNMHGHANTWEEELVGVARERDALRAENATLRQDVISLAKGYEDRIIELHAELTKEQEVNRASGSIFGDKLDTLRAENERLHEDIARAHWEAREQQAVITRLRQVLEQYADPTAWGEGWQWQGEHAGWVLAQRAL